MAFRTQNRDLSTVMREVEENLAIFLGTRNGVEKQRIEQYVVNESDKLENSTSVFPKHDNLLTSNASHRDILQIAADYKFSELDIERIDYDWRLTQPDNSLLSSIEVAVQESIVTHTTEISNNGNIIPEYEQLENTSEQTASVDNSPLQPVTSTAIDSYAAARKRSILYSRNQKPAPISATTTQQPALPSKSKPSRTSRATVPSLNFTATQPRSSAPSKSTSHSSIPIDRSSVPVISKSRPRSFTLTHKPMTPSISSSISASDKFPSGKKVGPTVFKNPDSSRGTSFRPLQQSVKLSLSHKAVENSKTLMPKRPASASRVRLRAPTAQLASSNGKQIQKSFSPTKVTATNNEGHKNGSVVMLSRSRGYKDGGDDVNPVLMGTKMVEIVMSIRKLASPKQDKRLSHDNTRKSSKNNLGFGRSLSKKSLEMAIRHMDIRRSIPDSMLRV